MDRLTVLETVKDGSGSDHEEFIEVCDNESDVAMDLTSKVEIKKEKDMDVVGQGTMPKPDTTTSAATLGKSSILNLKLAIILIATANNVYLTNL